MIRDNDDGGLDDDDNDMLALLILMILVVLTGARASDEAGDQRHGPLREARED